MRLDCPQGHAAVVRQDPNSTGMLAMCDVCGWSATKVAAQFDRAQREEQKRRDERQRQLAPGRDQEEEEQLEAAAPSRRRAD